MTSKDDVPTDARPDDSDAHGHAALLLVESLIHGLCENRTLTAAQAGEVAGRAVDVQADLARHADAAAAGMWRSHALLSRITASLRSNELASRPRLV